MAEPLAAVDRLMADWLERQSAGTAEAPGVLIASHPEHSDELKRRFAALDLLDAARLERSVKPVAIPDWIDEYEIVRVIGRGGMGVVFEAEQTSMGRRVALKVLSKDLTTSEVAVQRFLREARAAGRLKHPNIVPVHAMGQEGEHWFFSMELVDGEPLDEKLAGVRSRDGGAESRSPAYLRRTAELFAGVAEALDLAHEQGVVHRDIKPSNLILAENGTLRVVDFGLAQLEGDGRGVTRTGRIVGTPAYMSPEQAGAGSLPVDHRTDVYSLGATLYEALTLGPLFEAEDVRKLYGQILQHEPRPPRRLNPAIPRDLEAVVLKSLEKQPHRRYATCAELAEDLRRFVAGRPVRARRVGPIGRAVRTAARHKLRTALVSAVLLLGTVAAILSIRASERQAALLAIQYDDLCARADVASSGAAFAVPQGFVGASALSVDAQGGGQAQTAHGLCTRAIELVPERPEAYLRRALSAGVDDSERLEDLERALERGISPRTYHLARAQVLTALSREADAGDARADAERHELHSALDHYFEARFASAAGRVDEAIELLTSAMRLAGDDRKLFMHALRLRAGIHENLVSRDRALADLLVLQGLGDEGIALEVRIAAAWMRLSRPDITERVQEAVVTRVRKMGGAAHWLELLSALRSNRQRALQAQLVSEALEAHPGDPLLELEAAFAHSHRNRHAEAAHTCETLLDRPGVDAAAWRTYAEVLAAARRHEDVVRAADEAITREPARGRSHELRGNALRLLGRYDDAIESLKEAVRLAPWSLSARVRLARCYEALERWQDVEATLQVTLATKPAASEAFVMFRDALERQGREEDARSATRRLLATAKKLAGSFTAQANFHFYLGEYEEAHAAATAALRYRRSKVREMYRVQIESLRRLGRAADAIEAAAPGLRQYPRNVAIRLAYAHALLDTDRVEDAQMEIRRVLTRQPRNEDARALQAMATQVAGRSK